MKDATLPQRHFSDNQNLVCGVGELICIIIRSGEGFVKGYIGPKNCRTYLDDTPEV